MIPSKKRLLILSASGGAGHIRAGEALLSWSQKELPDVHAEHHDVLDFTSKTFKRLYGETYLKLVQHAPELWGLMYASTEKKPYKKPPFLRIFDHFNYKRYLAALEALAPDAVVCTHFLPFVAIENRIIRQKVRMPFFAVGTDFNLHGLWVSKSVAHYFVHSEETAVLLAARGVPPERVTATGIPVVPAFAEPLTKRVARERLGLPTDRETILVLSGGYGVGNIEKIVDAVERSCASLGDRQFSVVVVCGKNADLKRTLSRPQPIANVRRTVVGFVGNMQEFMFASDIVISKSGGLTSSEALATALPMIIVDPIPGQERLNADMLVEGGAALIASNAAQLTYKVQKALRDPVWIRKASDAARQMGKPMAGRDIVRAIWMLGSQANRNRE